MFTRNWPVNESIENEVGQLRQQITAGLEKRMKVMEKDKNLIIATMLDPRYKNAVFPSEDRARKVKLVLKELKQLQEATPVSNNNSPIAKRAKMTETKSLMSSMLDDLDESGESTEESDKKDIKSELDDYFKEKRISYDFGPSAALDYWRVSKFDLLKKLAQRFLCPPPSSVESERLFSQLKMIYTDKRSNLSGEHAEQQLFLRYIWSKDE